MLRKLSPFIRLIETPAPEAGGSEVAQEAEAAPEAGDANESDEQADAVSEDEIEALSWDPQKAREKFTKLNREHQRLRERAKAAEEKLGDPESLARSQSELRDVKAENLRLRLAIKHGLPMEVAERLRGDTDEELEQDAEKLLALFSPGKTPAPTNRPKPNLRGGVLPGGEPEKDAKAIVEEALGR